MDLRVAQFVPDTEAEGPGRRFAVWVQGCPLACPGCCNPEMFSPVGGRSTPSERLADLAFSTPGIEGVSVLGGEPFQQALAVADFAARVRARGLSVMVYSGYTLDELRQGSLDGAAKLLAQTDLLVDGRYRRELPETRRRWIGSSNQVLHFLTDRYAKDDPRFSSGNTVELRLTREGLLVNGWPEGTGSVFAPQRGDSPVGSSKTVPVPASRVISAPAPASPSKTVPVPASGEGDP